MNAHPLAHAKVYWVIVANEAQATSFVWRKRNQPPSEVSQLHNDIGQSKAADLMSDKGGRSFDSHGEGRHTITREKSGPRQDAAAKFAGKIVQELETAMRRGDCESFILIAAPRFLGTLRGALRQNEPALTIDKDLIGSDGDTIFEHLKQHF